MAIVSGCFLCIEDDVDLSEIVLEDWRTHSNEIELGGQLVFLKGTRAALCELHDKKQDCFHSHGLDRFFWTKNKRLTEDDALLITALFNFFLDLEKKDYAVFMYNFPSTHKIDSEIRLGWNIRRIFDWVIGDPSAIGLFADYHDVRNGYEISDWLDYAFKESIDIYSDFFSRLSGLLKFEEIEAVEGHARRRDSNCLRSIQKEVKDLKKRWLSLSSEYYEARSIKLDEFIGYSVSSINRIFEGDEGLGDYYHWKSVIFGAKARSLARMKNYDHAYLWCHRSLEEYLKSLVVKLDRARFKEDKCWWDGEPVTGVMKYLNIVKDQVSDVVLYDKIVALKSHVSLRNYSTIGHGSKKIKKREVEDFFYEIAGMVNMFNRAAGTRVTWLDRVKQVEELHSGELLRIFSRIVIKKSGIVPLDDFFT